MTGGLVVGGTTSDAGKSLITAGLCRWLARAGVKVAPFKAQNMSNNSMVVPGGTEVGRAQWLQAVAAGVVPDADMNPVLLKPGSDMTSHIVLQGKPYRQVHSRQWRSVRPRLAEAAFDSLAQLRSRFDVVIAEGAGSPAEINLRDGDFTNLGLAQHARWPMLVVGDIDRGGVLAAFYGTLAICDEQDQQLIAGWLVNKFRGHRDLLAPGIRQVEQLTGRPTYGVVPHLEGVWVDAEDSLSLGVRGHGAASGTAAGEVLQVAVVRFPRVSNSTDVDALAAEPGVQVTLTTQAEDVASADVVLLPGSRATVSDLTWLRNTGLAEVIVARARQGRPVVGICGGYQMLAQHITDTVESSTGTVPGLGLLPTEVTFRTEKSLGQPTGEWAGHPVVAYEIHHGVAQLVTTHGAAHDPATSPGQPSNVGPAMAEPGLGAGPTDIAPFLDGWQQGAVWGTTWHGAWENDDFRRAWCGRVAEQAAVAWRPATATVSFVGLRESMIDTVADAIEEHVDTDGLLKLIEQGIPAHLPTRQAGFR